MHRIILLDAQLLTHTYTHYFLQDKPSQGNGEENMILHLETCQESQPQIYIS